jgi:hypothetical protein
MTSKDVVMSDVRAARATERMTRETAWLLNRCNPGAHSIRSIDVARVIRRKETGLLERIAQVWSGENLWQK